MMFFVLTITFVLMQLSSCIQSDLPAEELVQTYPTTIQLLDSSSTISVSSIEHQTEAKDSGTNYPELEENPEFSQNDSLTTSSPVLYSAALSKITWNPVTSKAFTIAASTNSTNYESTFPSNSLPNSSVNSGTSILHQTTPPMYDNLDHGENELDSDTRIADSSKTTMKPHSNSDLIKMYKLSTISTKDPTNHQHVFSSTASSLSSETESDMIPSESTVHSLSSQISTGKPTNSKYEGAMDSITDILDSVDMPLNQTSTSSNYFETTKGISERETHGGHSNKNHAEDETLVTETIQYQSQLPNDSKSTIYSPSQSAADFTLQNDTNGNFTTANYVETEEQEYNSHSPNPDMNPSYTEVSGGHGLTQISSFSKEPESSKEPTLTFRPSTVTDSIMPEIFSTAHTDSLPPDISPHVGISHSSTLAPLNISLLENSTDSVSKEDYFLTTVEITTASEDSVPLTKPSTHSSVSDVSPLADNMSLSSTTSYYLSNISETETSSVVYSNTVIGLPETRITDENTTIFMSVSGVTETATSPSVQLKTTDHRSSLGNEMQTSVSSLERDTSNIHGISTDASAEREINESTTISSSKEVENTVTAQSSSRTFNYVNSLPVSTDFSIVTGAPEKAIYTYKEKNPATQIHLPSTTPNDTEDPSSFIMHSTSLKNKYTKSMTDISTEQYTVSHPHFPSTTTLSSVGSVDISTTLNPNPVSTAEEITVSQPETFGMLTQFTTSSLDISSTTINPDAHTPSATPEKHREGKHIPFSTTAVERVTVASSEYGFLMVTSDGMSTMRTVANGTEMLYNQIRFEDLDPVAITNMITAIIQFPMNEADMKMKLAKAHNWLDHVLTKEFKNWTRDPFDEDEKEIKETPFGNISIFYVVPTPETNASHITLTFVVYNAWKNDTLPVHFVLGILNFYSTELKESVNASAAYFYHGLLSENYDLLSAVLDKYGIIIFTICLAVAGITLLICVVVYYRKKTRQSVHCLADSKLQHNLQEAVGIDLTPASIILQDEKGDKGSKICDDEGWLVPIADIPLAEDGNVPNVQDTKL